MQITQQFIDSYGTYLRRQFSGSERTVGERKKTLRLADRTLPEGLIMACTEELEQWLWRDGLSIGSRETYYGALNGFFTWAYINGHIDYNPMESISRPNVPKRLPNPVTDAQLTYALNHAAEPYLLWIKLAAYAGCRCIDIAHLLRENVTEDNVMIRRSKGGKQRAVPTHPIIWEAVKDLPAGPVTCYAERRISAKSVGYFHHSLDMRGVHLHRFRHWFGTMVQRLHRDLRVTQELLGHENPASTAGYALVASQDKATAVGLLPTLGASAGASVAAAAGSAALR